MNVRRETLNLVMTASRWDFLMVLNDAHSDEHRAADYGGGRFCRADKVGCGQITALRCLQHIGAGSLS